MGLIWATIDFTLSLFFSLSIITIISIRSQKGLSKYTLYALSRSMNEVEVFSTKYTTIEVQKYACRIALLQLQ